MARIDERSSSAREPSVRAWLERFRAVSRGLYEADLATGLGHEIAADSFEESGNLRNALRERTNLGTVYLLAGSYARAEHVLRDALGAAQRMGLPVVEAGARQALSLVLAGLGRLEEGRDVAARSVVEFEAQSDRRMLSAALSYLARIELRLGGIDEALTHVRAAVDAGAEHPAMRALALATLAEIELAERRPTDALHAARQAKAILDSPAGVEEGHVLIRLVHAEALHDTGALPEAHRAIDEARASLLVAAGKISDPALARSFVENVSENARTLELARQWLDPADRTVA
jgi:eukaryotic-like serine/threonine-protein kinase